VQLGPYAILGELGRGGMGVVYRARRADLDRDFAVKVIRLDDAATPELIARFRREAQAAARLAGHPNIAAVHDIGEADGQLYLVMDCVSGGSLADLIDADDLSPRRAAELAGQAARGLAHAHAAGVLHRDVKPDNILIGADGTARVADFGLARDLHLDADTRRLTQTGVVLGTAAYMAPEQARGQGADPRADCYALGASLYEALTRRPPFIGDTTGELLVRLLSEAPAPPSRHAPGVPPDLETIVLHCLAKDPAERYPSAGALADDLERFLRGEPITAAPAAVRLRRRATMRALAVAGAALGLGGAVWGILAGAPDDLETGRQVEQLRAAADVSQWATAVSAAWFDLHQASAAEMRLLEDVFRGAPVPEAEVTRALAAVRAAVVRAEADHPIAVVPRAWWGTALMLAGDPRGVAEAEAAEAAAGHDPLPFVLQAWRRFVEYTAATDLPALYYTRTGLRRDPLRQSGYQDDLRAQIARSLDAARTRPAFARLLHGETARQFAAAADAFARGDHAAAGAVLEELARDPLFGGAASHMRGLLAFAVPEPDAALAAWAPLRARGWPHVQVDSGNAWMAAATARDQDDPKRLAELQQALAAYDAALAAGGPARRPWIEGRAVVLGHIAQFQRAAGADPRDMFEAAVAAYDVALALEPGRASTLRNYAQLVDDYARWEQERARNGTPRMEQAIALAERAMADPDQVAQARLLRAGMLISLGRWAAYARRDPTSYFAQARDDLDPACNAAPPDPVALSTRGTLHREWAAWLARTGDPRPWYAAAVADYRAALRLRPGLRQAAGHLVRVHLAHAEWAQRGGDPAPHYTAAGAAVARAIERFDDAPLRHLRGSVHLSQGRWRMRRRQDPTTELEQAVRWFTAAVDRRPAYGVALVNRGVCHALWADWIEGNGGDPTTHHDRAVADFERGAEADPARADFAHSAGQGHYARAQRVAAAGGDALPHWQRAFDYFSRAVAADPEFPRSRKYRCGVADTLADAAAAADPARAGELRALAAEDAGVLCRLQPRSALAQTNHAILLEKLGQLRPALAAFERALELKPGDAALSARIAGLRAKLR
jgi:serine/threonine-protein kinase